MNIFNCLIILDYNCRGSHGSIYKIIELTTNRTLAAKFIDTKSQLHKERIRKEFDIMKHLNHERIVKYYNLHEAEDKTIIIVEM